jgi:hypothetical protein
MLPWVPEKTFDFVFGQCMWFHMPMNFSEVEGGGHSCHSLPLPSREQRCPRHAIHAFRKDNCHRVTGRQGY